MFAVALLDDSKASCKTQASAFAVRLGGKKRFKQMRFNLIGHTCACVCNGQRNVVTSPHIVECFNLIPVQTDIRSHDGQFTTLWHGIAGIHCQIHEELFNLTGIGVDLSRIRVQCQCKTQCPFR